MIILKFKQKISTQKIIFFLRVATNSNFVSVPSLCSTFVTKIVRGDANDSDGNDGGDDDAGGASGDG